MNQPHHRPASQLDKFDRPSKLGWDLGAVIDDGLADQDVIPFCMDWLSAIGEVLNWLAKNCKRGIYSIWYKQADLEEKPLSTDQPGWYLTHLVLAGQTSKKPTINRSAGHTSQCISPIVDLPANLTKVHYEPATQCWLTSSSHQAARHWTIPTLNKVARQYWFRTWPIIHWLAQSLLHQLQTEWLRYIVTIVDWVARI